MYLFRRSRPSVLSLRRPFLQKGFSPLSTPLTFHFHWAEQEPHHDAHAALHGTVHGTDILKRGVKLGYLSSNFIRELCVGNAEVSIHALKEIPSFQVTLDLPRRVVLISAFPTVGAQSSATLSPKRVFATIHSSDLPTPVGWARATQWYVCDFSWYCSWY